MGCNGKAGEEGQDHQEQCVRRVCIELHVRGEEGWKRASFASIIATNMCIRLLPAQLPLHRQAAMQGAAAGPVEINYSFVSLFARGPRLTITMRWVYCILQRRFHRMRT